RDEDEAFGSDTDRGFGSEELRHPGAVPLIVGLPPPGRPSVAIPPGDLLPARGPRRLEYAHHQGVCLWDSARAVRRVADAAHRLEGEGYILATSFALLIPVYLSSSNQVMDRPATVDEFGMSEAPQEAVKISVWGRFGRAVVLNLKASVLVAIVLAVAACYEAFEVIRMAGLWARAGKSPQASANSASRTGRRFGRLGGAGLGPELPFGQPQPHTGPGPRRDRSHHGGVRRALFKFRGRTTPFLGAASAPGSIPIAPQKCRIF